MHDPSAQPGPRQCMHGPYEGGAPGCAFVQLGCIGFRLRFSGVRRVVHGPAAGGARVGRSHRFGLPALHHARWQPMHRVASDNSPTASSGGVFFGRGPAKDPVPPSRPGWARNDHLEDGTPGGGHVTSPPCFSCFPSPSTPQLFGRHRTRPDQGPDRQPATRRRHAYAAVVRVDGR